MKRVVAARKAGPGDSLIDHDPHLADGLGGALYAAGHAKVIEELEDRAGND